MKTRKRFPASCILLQQYRVFKRSWTDLTALHSSLQQVSSGYCVHSGVQIPGIFHVLVTVNLHQGTCGEDVVS